MTQSRYPSAGEARLEDHRAAAWLEQVETPTRRRRPPKSASEDHKSHKDSEDSEDRQRDKARLGAVAWASEDRQAVNDAGVCSVCGTYVGPHAKRCLHCGAPFVALGALYAHHRKEQGKRVLALAFLLLLVVLVIGATLLRQTFLA